MTSQCEICGHKQTAPAYDDWTCKACGQKYEYEEGHRIVLSQEQRERLQPAKAVCRNCRWWGEEREIRIAEEDGDDWRLATHRQCNCPTIVDGSDLRPDNDPPDDSLEWRKSGEQRIEEQVPANGAAYKDREGYAAEFLTGPLFGCVHWEAVS